MFEADGDFMAFLAEFLRYLVEHVGGADVADDGALPAFVFYQVVVGEHHDVVGVEEFSFVVNDARRSASPSVAMPMSHFPSRTKFWRGRSVAAVGAGSLPPKSVSWRSWMVSTSHLAVSSMVLMEVSLTPYMGSKAVRACCCGWPAYQCWL